MSKNNSVENVTDDDVKYYVLVKDGYMHYAPQYLSAGMMPVEIILPVPEPNAVGTLDFDSTGIAIIKFGAYGKEPECKLVAKDFSDSLLQGAAIQLCPNFSEDTIAYSVKQGAIVANVKTGEAFIAECEDWPEEGDFGSKCGCSSDDIQDYYFVHGIRFLNPQKNLFVIAKYVDESYGGFDLYLHVVSLNGRRLVYTGWSKHLGKSRSSVLDVPLYNIWFVHDRKLFVYDNGKMLCTDGSQPVSHPFSEVFNNNSDRIGNIRDLAIHPTLPFGVMIEDYVSGSIIHQLKIICWKARKRKNQIVAFSDIFEPLAPLFNLKRIAFAYSSFSPDGNWYEVGCLIPEMAAEKNLTHDPFFIAIPIDGRHPNFLVVKDIIILGQVKNMTSLAWTTAPVSFVVSNGELLHKWDLNELPAARVFVVPESGGATDGGRNKKNMSIFKKIRNLFRL